MDELVKIVLGQIMIEDIDFELGRFLKYVK